ncbi:MAG: glycosyltransferase family 2 protein [Nanoarchaeota archaeon]|nr:glycosyltransferase family 2 protein [Nanoarchaeota archaeon]MBU1030231.1 glycosyltransferase family 2 protein [Nanoarchaeota archaeon]
MIFRIVKFKLEETNFKTSSVSVIIPVHGKTAFVKNSVESILRSDYLIKEILIVFDEPHDPAIKLLRKHFGSKLKFVKNLGKGKWSALNTGVQNANGEIIVFVDSDTIICQDAISRLVNHFSSSEISAVAGNIIPMKKDLFSTVLKKEYLLNFLERRIIPSKNMKSLIAGNIGAFRKSVFSKINFTGETLCEDFDFSLRFQEAGFKSVVEPKAYAFDNTPSSFKLFLKQRNRWYRGVFQVLSKNRFSPWLYINLKLLPVISQMIFLWLLVFSILTGKSFLFIFSISLFLVHLFIIIVFGRKFSSQQSLFKEFLSFIMFFVYFYFLNFLMIIIAIEEFSKFKVSWERI